MTIYTSEKVMPYVYMCTHKTTGQFYIGSRTTSTQKGPSHVDFPKYKSSSKQVKPNFDQYDWFIVAEFFTPTDAYDFEQQLIHEHWDNPLKLNQSCFYGKQRWSTTGLPSPKSEITRQKLSTARAGKKRPDHIGMLVSQLKAGVSLSDDHKRKIGEGRRGKFHSEESKKRMSEAHKRLNRSNRAPLVHSDETKAKMSAAKKGKPWSEETRRRYMETRKKRALTKQSTS